MAQAIKWGIDQFFIDKQVDRKTAYIDLPASFKTFSLKEKVAFMAAVLNHNSKILQSYLQIIAKMPTNRRMYRITLLCFPHYFNRSFSWLYKDLDYKKTFYEIGAFCRKHHIRISIHAPMYVYLGIDTAYNWFAINRMGQLFREFGYTKPYQDGTCFCIHSTYKHLQPYEINSLVKENVDANNLMFCAVENTHTENSLYNNCELENVALIVDLHHHLVANQKYLSAKSKLWHHVKKTWHNVTPKIHLSVPRLEEARVDGDKIVNGKRILEDLIPGQFYASNYSPHGDYIWGKKYLNWARTFDADTMIEAALCATATKMASKNITTIED